MTARKCYGGPLTTVKVTISVPGCPDIVETFHGDRALATARIFAKGATATTPEASVDYAAPCDEANGDFAQIVECEGCDAWTCDGDTDDDAPQPRYADEYTREDEGCYCGDCWEAIADEIASNTEEYRRERSNDSAY